MINEHKVRVVVEGGTPNPHYFNMVQTDVVDEAEKEPGLEGSTHRDFVIESVEPTVPSFVINTPSDLDIRAQVGNAIVDDDTTISNHATLTTTIKVSVLRKQSDSSLEVWIFTHTDGIYGNTPAGYDVEHDIVDREVKIVPAGTVIEEI